MGGTLTRFWLVICSLFVFSNTAVAAHDCFDDAIGAQQFSYCITQLPNANTSSVIYHLHGRNLDHNIWNDDTYYPELLKAEWAATQSSPPLIVTISFGKVWVLSPAGNAPKTGLRVTFEEAMFRIERQHGLDGKKRLVLGESMGGFNAIQLLQTGHFEKAAILCPTIYELNYPFSVGSLRDLIHQTRMDYQVALGLWWIAGDYVRSQSDWQAISPLDIVKSLQAGAAPKLYVSCGSRDQYGNFPGTQKFAQTALEKGSSMAPDVFETLRDRYTFFSSISL